MARRGVHGPDYTNGGVGRGRWSPSRRFDAGVGLRDEEDSRRGRGLAGKPSLSGICSALSGLNSWDDRFPGVAFSLLRGFSPPLAIVVRSFRADGHESFIPNTASIRMPAHGRVATPRALRIVRQSPVRCQWHALSARHQ